jgi:hypothetical protein
MEMMFWFYLSVKLCHRKSKKRGGGCDGDRYVYQSHCKKEISIVNQIKRYNKIFLSIKMADLSQILCGTTTN